MVPAIARELVSNNHTRIAIRKSPPPKARPPERTIWRKKNINIPSPAVTQLIIGVCESEI
jgi:hypothetical protein